jgi:hypothetical protein
MHRPWLRSLAKNNNDNTQEKKSSKEGRAIKYNDFSYTMRRT